MSREPRRSRARGFTLIELLVAMAVFSLLATFMYSGIQAIVRDRGIIMDRLDELDQLQRTARTLDSDILQLQSRDVRDELGRANEPAIYTDPAGDFVVRLSRAGWRNPGLRRKRSILQRVQYRVEDEVLYRDYWPVLDRVLGMEPISQALINGVTEFALEFLDASNEWQPVWPPRDANNPVVVQLPQGVRYRLVLENFGEIERLVEVAQ
jgi:general secretion pathway protein J